MAYRLATVLSQAIVSCPVPESRRGLIMTEIRKARRLAWIVSAQSLVGHILIALNHRDPASLLVVTGTFMVLFACVEAMLAVEGANLRPLPHQLAYWLVGIAACNGLLLTLSVFWLNGFAPALWVVALVFLGICGAAARRLYLYLLVPTGVNA
jgi:hypothetical protein